jgi:hypothetical protein
MAGHRGSQLQDIQRRGSQLTKRALEQQSRERDTVSPLLTRNDRERRPADLRQQRGISWYVRLTRMAAACRTARKRSDCCWKPIA